MIQMNVLPIILLSLGALILTIGDVLMKKWVVENKILFYFAGLVIWLVGLNFLALSFKYKNIAVASTIFVVLNVAMLSFASWVYFNEKLSLLEILGICLGITSVIVLEFAGNLK